jgi:hypothetical protein
MWVFDNDYNKWSSSGDSLVKDEFDFLKQELSAVRFYSKCLSGATYLPMNNLNNIYDILGEYEPRNWYVGLGGSPYSNSLIPPQHATEITADSSYDYYTKYLTEYGLTLKNLFTPNRLIKDSIDNYIYVDVITSSQLFDLYQPVINRNIDGVRLLDGHKILIKDQKSTVVLPNTTNPDDYFVGNYTEIQNFGTTIEYEYYNNENGIYKYENNLLSKESDLDDYEDCVRFSVIAKLGANNKEKQFHLSRLLNGYYPTSLLDQPMEFIEKHNWLLRNRVDYNNLFEINYYDVIKHSEQIYHIEGITYSIPERTISVGEFGVILNNQEGVSNIIGNKYKVNLRGISQTSKYYWICGDGGVLLRVRKHDFDIKRIEVDCNCPRNLKITNLKSISFYDNLRGVAVGELNTILVTNDGGFHWERIKIPDFDAYYYNKVIFYDPNKFFIGGNAGVFIEFIKDISGWTAYKRRISRFVDEEDEYLLVDNINDILYTNIDTWGLTHSHNFGSQSISVDKELLFIVTDDSKFIVHDINNSIPDYDFLYLDFRSSDVALHEYGDIRNISRREGTNDFYFTGINDVNDEIGLFSFDINVFTEIGVEHPHPIEYSNTITTTFSATHESILYSNEIFDYLGDEMILCGNESLLRSSTYSTTFNFEILDDDFESRLKSKMLFLDYDMGSKLNFFTDDGQYRLPNSLRFASDSFASTSSISFSSLVYGATSPSFMTQSEVSWFDYWSDRYKTFEFYSTGLPMDESTKVLLSSTFSYSATQSELIISSITSDLSDIQNLAPNIYDRGVGRFNGGGMTAISAPSSPYDLYLYDYLMVAKVADDYEVVVGDAFGLESNVVNSEFVVNKIAELGGDKYLYMFSEFNQNIITELSTTTYSVTLTNLNKYSGVDELEERFNTHPISNGYELIREIVPNSVSMDFTLGTTASYTGWDVDNNLDVSAPFQIGTTPFPVSPIFSSSPYSAKTSATNSVFYIESPVVDGVDSISFYYTSDTPGGTYNSGTFSKIKVQALSGVSWIDLATYNMPLNQSVFGPGVVPTPTEVIITGDYPKFRIEITQGLLDISPIFGPNFTTSPVVYIDDIKLSSSTNLVVNDDTYGIIGDDDVTINPLFNNLTSYYNLATNVIFSGDYHTMSYTDGFLKFGYTPTYNLLDYLESINDIGDPNPTFYGDKEFYAMPDYRGIPLPGISTISDSDAYIDYNGVTYSNTAGNKISFGVDLKLEWESIFINTFVDVNLYDSATYSTPSSSTERLLVMKKYFNERDNVYVIEFHKKLNLALGTPLYFVDIISRRKLHQISSDLQELNNIQRGRLETNDGIFIGSSFDSYERELNFKIPTDSYAKIMLSDAETLQELSTIFYIDDKNELSMNMTRLERKYNIPILTTSNFGGKLFIACSEKHDLKTGEGVVLDFTGDVDGNGDPIIGGSSKELNQQYFGYHPVIVVNQYNFYVDIDYGTIPTVGNDRGFVRYTKKDPFLNYQPVDIIDIGVDKKGKRSIELLVDNLILTDDVYSLVGVDFDKYRFRLVDGLNVEQLAIQFPWILEAEISDAVLGLDDGGLVWYSGTWECGRWFGGTWYSGSWLSGDWYGGNWYSKIIKDNYISVEVDQKSSDTLQSTWFGGRWYDGTWNNGLWVNGRWYGGNWNDGTWFKGIWNDGTWNNGVFGGGVWVLGVWNNGVFNTDNEPAYWLDGKWFGGDFENGMWYNGLFEAKNGESRFGVNSYNSRTSTWHGGDWVSGSFHSRLNLNDDDEYDVSDSHKLSVWKTGSWFSGDFYGGVAYNIDFKSGIWHGGILEDIQVIGFGFEGEGENYFTLNGIFKFNIGDEFNIIDNQIGNAYSNDFGSNSDPGRYTVLYTTEDNDKKWTKVYVNRTITYNVYAPVDLGLRLVSRFRFVNWKSGIWTNGILDSGLWEGGLWYNGVFGDATWM